MPHDDTARPVTPSTSTDAEGLTSKALRLIELDRLIVRSIIEWQPQALSRHLSEFADIKTSLRKTLIERPLIHLPGSAAADARAVLKKIAAGEPLPVERALSGGVLRNALPAHLTDDDFEEIGREALYSWMNHSDYAEGLYKAGALVVACGDIPKNLERFVDEARQCFAFQQFNAVCALCRTMIEIAVRDLALAYGVIPRDSDKVSHLASRGKKPHGPDLAQRINLITEFADLSHLRNPLHRVRQSTNAIIHGDRSVSEGEAARVLKETLDSIHRLYEAHEKARRHKKR